MTAFHIVFRRFARILFLAAAAMPLPALAQTTTLVPLARSYVATLLAAETNATCRESALTMAPRK